METILLWKELILEQTLSTYLIYWLVLNAICAFYIQFISYSKDFIDLLLGDRAYRHKSITNFLICLFFIPSYIVSYIIVGLYLFGMLLKRVLSV